MKRPSSRSPLYRVSLSFGVASLVYVAAPTPIPAAELPVPCVAGVCGSNIPGFVTRGQATATIVGNALDVFQQSDSALLNWQSFNISPDGVVTFHQPDSSSVAINRIHEIALPSRILGQLNANGRVYLLNRNGIVFGEGAQVNVGGLVAASLDITEDAVNEGIAGAIRLSAGGPAFTNVDAATGQVFDAGKVETLPGARLEASGGQILLIAPEVVNRGSIRTPDGQTILAGGENIYFATSTDQNLRGLFVEVKGEGVVVNGEDANASRAAAEQVGRIAADRGNVTLAALTVRQAGQISATTSTRANGTVRLLARTAEGSATETTLRNEEAATRGGELTLADGSKTEITLEHAPDDVTVDANAQPRSRVQLSARQIEIGSRTEIRATAGQIEAVASELSNAPLVTAATRVTNVPDESRLIIASDAILDVSGATTSLPMERNVIRVELRGNQLADSPLQRGGALRSEAVYVDVRESGTRDDGSTWQGTPLADVSGDISNIRRDVVERSLDGGTISLLAGGAVIVGRGAQLDVSGGSIDWQSGYIRTSQLLGADGRIYDISDAPRDQIYSALLDTFTVTDRRWGTKSTYRLPVVGDRGRFEAGYVEGRNAGAVSILSPRVILDGDINGETVAGRYQRREPSTTGPLAFDQLPRAASLTIGRDRSIDRVTTNVEFTPEFAQAAGIRLDNLADLVPEDLEAVQLRPELFGADRVGNLTLFSNEQVHIGGDAPLSLPGSGNLSITAGRVIVDAGITIPSGTISLVSQETAVFQGASPEEARGLIVGSSVALSTRGVWVNDDVRFNPDGAHDPLLIDGGSIALSVTNGPLQLSADSLIDVSGGAQRRANGSIVAGRGGSISLSASSPTSGVPDGGVILDGTLSGYALTRGGSLSIATSSICISATECGDPEPGLTVDPAWFATGGFESIALTANLGDARVENGTVISLQQRNLELSAAAAEQRSGESLAGLTSVIDLPDHLRRPMNLSLRSGYQQGAAPGDGSLYVGQGAALLGDPGATLALRSDSSLIVDGTLLAPGGAISLTVDSTNSTEYRADQGIWISGVLDAAGVARLQPARDDGRMLGTVLDGGTVTIDAQRGFVFTDPNSVISVAGTRQTLDLPVAEAQFASTEVASRGGNVAITAAEGMLLNGALQGASGAPGSVEGGSIKIELDSTRRIRSEAALFPNGDRTVLVTNSSAPILVAPETALPEQLLGIAHVPVARLADGGFDSVTLEASNVIIPPQPQTGDIEERIGGYGRVLFENGVNLATRSRLTLAAGSVGIAEGLGRVNLESGYISLDRTNAVNVSGQTNLLLATDAPDEGSGQLRLSAALVDVIGNVSLDGVARTSIVSSGDIRGTGVLASASARDYAGSLRTTGSLELTAQQIYPTTLSSFRFQAGDADGGSIHVHAADGVAAPVLSAGGRLTLAAPVVEVAGALRAPFGELAIEADSIDVLSGGVLSTSADGQIIPFGTTQGGLIWSYEQANDITRLYGPDQAALPEQRVSLTADTINLASGSVVDVSGGGDLQAYEFIRGPGGSTDVLAASERPNQFAILPQSGLRYAPHDHAESAGAQLEVGDTIWLAEGSGVPAGEYTLLPARYALLPGAFLVESVAGYADLLPTQPIQTRSGGVIVAGRRGVSGTELRDARTSGFLVRPGSEALVEARYDITRANDFFARIDPEGEATRRPRDAGTLSIAALDELALDGTLRAATQTGGRGSTVEIAAPDLAIVGVSGDVLPGEVLEISAERLSALGAQTLLLGGRRIRTADGESIEVAADSVRLMDGVRLSSPEILLVANDSIRLEALSELVATGSAFESTTELSLPGQASLLRVSTADQLNLTRTSSAPTGASIEVIAGALVQAPGSITLDIAGQAMTEGRFDIGTGSLLVASDRIGLGTVADGYAGVSIGPQILSSVSAGTLELVAREGLDLFADTDFSTRSLSIDTPLLHAVDDDVRARLAAEHLTLSGGTAGTAPTTGAATLQLDVGELEMAGGMVALDRFASANVSARGDVTATEDSELVTTGNLTLGARALTTDPGTDVAFRAQGDVELSITDPAATSIVAAEHLGGAVTIEGNSIAGDVRVLAPAGDIELIAHGASGVRLGGQSLLDVSGEAVQFDGVDVAARGGNIRIDARAGDINIGGSRFDVSAADSSGADAGLVELHSAGVLSFDGTLVGAAQDRSAGASVSIDAAQLNFSHLRSLLDSGGFTGEWNVAQRGAGDLILAADERITARSLSLTADQGAIAIAGTIDAASPRGGKVALAASGPITVSGVIDARAMDANVRGGRVDLSSTSGVRLLQGSRIDVSGTTLADSAATPGGRVNVRTSRTALATVTGDVDPSNDAVRLDGVINGARGVTIEGVARYDTVGDLLISASDVLALPGNVWFDDATTFMAGAPVLLANLGLAADPRITVRPGIELTSTGSMTLSTDWNLFDWRFGPDAATPGVLTLRAGGDLRFDGSLNDGFSSPSVHELPTTNVDSWSYRIAGGAALASADPLAVRLAQDAPLLGSVVVGGGSPGTGSFQRVVRTGNGDIEVAAGGDFVLENTASVLYTAGVVGPGITIPLPPFIGGLDDLPYPIDAGDISIRAGRDILGARSTQLYTEWLLRTGSPVTAIPTTTAWTVDYARFEQGVATFGGGAISATAGRDIKDFSASTSSIGRQVGSTDPDNNVVEVVGGGDLAVRAGGSILGGQFYVDRGEGTIVAGSSFAAPGDDSLAPVLALGDASLDVFARRDLDVATAVNPSLLPPVDIEGIGLEPSAFGTYAPSTALSLVAAGGEVSFGTAVDSNTPFGLQYPNYPSVDQGAQVAARVAPPTLHMASLSDTLTITAPIALWPAPRGDLRLFALNDVLAASVVMSDAEVGVTLPSTQHVAPDASSLALYLVPGADPGFNAEHPVHAGVSEDDRGDLEPARIVALTGDVVGLDEAGTLYVPKQLRVSAGRDIVDFSTHIQHFDATNISTLRAGRDFIFSSRRSADGQLAPNLRQAVIDGPGRLEIVTGRDFDLQTSFGVVSRGNLINDALPTGGATISILAGLNEHEPAYEQFITDYLVDLPTYDEMLIDYVGAVTGHTPASKDEALAAYRAFTRSAQRPLLEHVLFAELRTRGREAAAPGPKFQDFTGAFAVLESFFPGSNPDLEANAENAYAGDIRLYFSRVYTLSGGDINLMAPGGEINVGLATPPLEFGLSKSPSDLGIVVQSTGSVNALSFRDFQVNESRTFAADGGDILVWSTRGDIDAGRGAKTAISAPPPVVTVNDNGQVTVSFPAALSGSGIQTLATSEGREPGNVDLFAPRGVVNAGDAGIVAGNLTIAATAVLGADNIQVSGVAVGVPVETSGLGVSLAGASSVASSASSAAASLVANGEGEDKPQESLADAALSWLEVFVVGLGEDTCKQDDVECLKRQTP